MTARLAQHRRGGDRNPYRNSIEHTAYIIHVNVLGQSPPGHPGVKMSKRWLTEYINKNVKPGEACVTRGYGFNSLSYQTACGLRPWQPRTTFATDHRCVEIPRLQRSYSTETSQMCSSPRLHILLMYWVNHLLDILAPGCPKGDWPNTLTIQRDPRTFEFAAGMGMDGNYGNSTCTHQHLASQRNSIYSTISTLHFQLLPCTWTLDATNMFEVLTQTQFKVIFCSFSLPTGAPSTRPRSTQYVRRWWHHNSAVAAVNPCSVSVPVQ